MSRFVKFGGAPYSAEFFSFARVDANNVVGSSPNLLEGDTAHIQQSIGRWTTAGGSNTFQQSTDLTSIFGDFVLRYTASTANPRATTAANAAPVVAGQTYAISAYVASDKVQNTKLAVSWYDSGDSLLGHVDVGDSGSGLVLAQLAGTLVAPVDATSAGVRLDTTGATAGDLFYVSAIQFADGTDTTFYPSKNIIGSLDLRTKLASNDYVATDHQCMLDTLTGSRGYYWRLTNTGNIWMYYGDGVDDRANVIIPDVPFVDGETYEIRMTYNIISGLVELYINGVKQTGTSSDTTNAGVANLQPITVASGNGGNDPVDGNLYWLEIRDGLAGPVVARFDPADYAGGAGSVPDLSTWTAPTGREWTSHGDDITNSLLDYGDSVAVEGLTIPVQTFIVKDPVGMPDEIDGGRWIVGAGWAGDGYKATMHQGNDALGPIVAQFDAEDIGL